MKSKTTKRSAAKKSVKTPVVPSDQPSAADIQALEEALCPDDNS